MTAVPVCWVSGAPGVGKSTTGWALYTRLAAAGHRVGYVDIDQLGLLLPRPADDPDAHRMQEANLAHVAATFARHGATQVVVSGCADPRGPDTTALCAAGLALTRIHLRCSPDELRRRYLGRGSTTDRLAELMALADTLDRTTTAHPVDTTHRTPEAVAATLAAHIGPPATTVPTPPAPPVTTTAGLPVLLLGGPTAVGKSTVGWSLARTLWDNHIPAAYIDADQFGFLAPTATPTLRHDHLHHLWHTYRTHGARALILTARGPLTPYLRSLSTEPVTPVHLHASPTALAHRITRRTTGNAPRLAGDPLIGADPHQAAARATAEAHLLRHTHRHIPTIDTTHRTPAEVVAAISTLLHTTPFPHPP